MNKEQFVNFAKLAQWFTEKNSLIKARKQQHLDNSRLEIKYKIGSDYDHYLKTRKVLIQSRTGPLYCYMTPKDVIDDQSIIGFMHPIDACAITKLCAESLPQNKHALEITREYIDKESNQYRYVLASHLNIGEIYDVSEEELYERYDLIEKLSAKASLSLGFKMGAEHTKKIRTEY